MADDTREAIIAAADGLRAALEQVKHARGLWLRDSQMGKVDGGAFPVPDRFPTAPHSGAAVLAEIGKQIG